MPANSNCLKNGVHQWVNLGIRGSIVYSCDKCDVQVGSKNTPDGSGCLKGGLHKWKKLG